MPEWLFDVIWLMQLAKTFVFFYLGRNGLYFVTSEGKAKARRAVWLIVVFEFVILAGLLRMEFDRP